MINKRISSLTHDIHMNECTYFFFFFIYPLSVICLCWRLCEKSPKSQPQALYLLLTLSADHADKAFAIPSPVEEAIPRASKVDTIMRSDVASLCFNSIFAKFWSKHEATSIYPSTTQSKEENENNLCCFTCNIQGIDTEDKEWIEGEAEN